MKESKQIKKYMENNKLNIEKVMSDFTPYLYTIIKNKNSNLTDEDLEEIISDVFLIVWKNQKKLDWNKEMSPYLGAITNNLFCKKIRKTGETVDINNYIDTLYDIKSIEQNAGAEQQNHLIIKELNKMKQEDKIIFMSYYYNSKSMKEIANSLTISEEKVKSRLFRIRKKLKKILEKRGYSYDG